MQDPTLCKVESTTGSPLGFPKDLEYTVNEAFCLLTHPWKCCLPSSWHHRVANSAISESREEMFIFFCNSLSFCLGQDVLIYHFLVNHKPEKDSGCFREGLHEALSHHESLLCQMLILHQKRVLLLRRLFSFFFFFLLSSVIWGYILPGRWWAPKNPVKFVGASASYVGFGTRASLAVT